MDNNTNNMNYDFEVYDFIADANFDQFVDLIRGENEDHGHHATATSFPFTDDLITACFSGTGDDSNTGTNFLSAIINPENNILNPNNPNVFGFGGDGVVPSGLVSSSGHGHEALPGFDGEIVMMGSDDEDEDEDSSGTTTNTTTNTTAKRSKVDRSRTLISERRRRGRMKEKLYALRSLVPNITKVINYE